MKNFFVLWRKELAACFLSPIAYVTMVIFIAVASGTFLVSALRSEGAVELLWVLLFRSLTLWLTVLVTVVCMRLFAEEKRLGTMETLMTAPVTDAEVVLGKYAGALTFVLIAAAPVVGSMFLLAAIAPGIGPAQIDGGAVAGGCLVILLLSGLYVSIGVLISLLTRNQIVAAIATFCAVWIALLLGWIVSFAPGIPARLAEYLSLTTHVEDFARGSVDTRPIMLAVSSIVFVLFSAIRVLESRKWR